MTEESRASETENRGHEDDTQGRQSAQTGTARMSAREWVVAANYSEPAAHGIPDLPEWTVRRTDSNGLAFAADDESAAFITARQPMRVRR